MKFSLSATTHSPVSCSMPRPEVKKTNVSYYKSIRCLWIYLSPVTLLAVMPVSYPSWTAGFLWLTDTQRLWWDLSPCWRVWSYYLQSVLPLSDSSCPRTVLPIPTSLPFSPEEHSEQLWIIISQKKPSWSSKLFNLFYMMYLQQYIHTAQNLGLVLFLFIYFPVRIHLCSKVVLETLIMFKNTYFHKIASSTNVSNIDNKKKYLVE